MRPIVLLAILAGVLSAADEDHQRRKILDLYASDIHPILEVRCIRCHGGETKKGGVDFARFAGGVNPLTDRALWRHVLAEVDAKAMPPENEPQLSATERYRLRAWLNQVKRVEKVDPGVTLIRRLSTREYGNTVRDLFGIDLRVEAEFPEDQAGEGFNNSISPLLMEKYLIAAGDIADHLIASDQLQRTIPAGRMAAVIGGVVDAGTSDGGPRRLEGPGELITTLNIPIEGSYVLDIRAAADQAGKEPVRLGIRFDGNFVHELKLTGKSGTSRVSTCRVRLLPGPTRFALTFMNPLGADETKTAGDQVRAISIESVQITGPRAKPPTVAQRRLITVTPGPDLPPREAARRVIEPIAFQAFRRPPRPHEIDTLLKVFDLAAAQDAGFNDGIKLMLKAILISPQFLFRTPDDPTDAGTTAAAIGPFELASRLSYLLWSTMPDQELLTRASDGTLLDPAVLAAQTRRMIADPRSQALIDTFAAQWLGIHKLADLVIDEQKFPLMTPAMRAGLYAECTTFMANLMRNQGSILDLLDSDYTYMNVTTAKLYGVESVKGPQMERVRLTDANRGGVMTMPAVLTITSLVDRTSPVRRGHWVLETLFDAAPPPPPPDVAALNTQDTPENARLTLRQKMELHRSDPNCASCHRLMDPLGFGFEYFDAIGRWRTHDVGGTVIDATGELPGQVRFSTPRELRRILLERRNDFMRVFIAKLLAFALARTLTDYDEIVVDGLAEQAIADGYRFDDIIVNLVASYSFLHRQPIR